MWTHKPPTSFKLPEIYLYMSKLLNCIHTTKHYKTSHGVLGAIQVLRNAFLPQIWHPPTPS